MKRILLILTFIFIGNAINAQDISCKKIFPMPSVMEVGEVFNLPNNQYLITNKKYDQDFNLVHEYTDLYSVSASGRNTEIFQNKIFATSTIGNISIKLFDSNTDTMLASYLISPLHNSDNSQMKQAVTGIDDNGNFYIFTVEENYFSGSGYLFYHRLYKFDNQLSLLWSKDYNPTNTQTPLDVYEIICFNDRVILSGLVQQYYTTPFNFNNVSYVATSFDRHFLFTINPSNGNINNYVATNCINNGQIQNFSSTKVFKYLEDVYLIVSEKSSTNEQVISFYRYVTTSSSVSLSSIQRVKSTSNYISPIGYAIKNNKLIVAARANTGNLTWWDGTTTPNNATDIIWLSSSINDFSNRNLNTSTTQNVSIYNFQAIDNKMGSLFSKYTDGTANIDEQSLYMQNGDIGFAVFSNDTGFTDIDFYTQTTPNSSNPNNYLNQDKPIRFKVKIKNELSQSLSTLSGTITSTTTGVTITDNSASFGNVSAGASIWSNDEFEITVDSTVPNGTLLEFELSTDDQVVSGGPWVSYFSFPIAPLQNGEIVLVDQNGNNDGNPDPSEHILLFPKIDNSSNATIAQVYGTLSSDDSFLNFASNYQKYKWVSNIHEPILPSDTNVLPEFPFELDYPASEPLQELNFNLELQGNLNDSNGALLKWQTTFSYNQGVEPPPVIVSTNPTDDATDIAIDSDFEITFDKNITAVSGKFLHLYKADNTLISDIEATDAQISITNEVVTINPTADLLGGTGYYIIIDQGAFIDATNNDFAGISAPTTWNFTTVQSNPPNAPVLTATAISDTEIELTWDVVDTATSYQIFSCDESITYTTNETNTTYTVSGLTEQTMYDFIVKAENQAGLSVASNCANAETFCNYNWGSPVIYTTFTRAFGSVTIDGQPATVEDKVGAFVGSELRGVGDIVMISGEAIAVININGDGVENASFIIWDASECSEVSVAFTVDTDPPNTIGSPNYLPIAGDTTASVDEVSLSNLITIYPNPTNDIIYIQNQDNLNIKKITVYNVLGKQILQVKDNTNEISTKTLTAGIYFMKIETEKGSLIKKIMKK